MDSDEEFTLTEDEAAALGITDRERTGLMTATMQDIMGFLLRAKEQRP